MKKIAIACFMLFFVLGFTLHVDANTFREVKVVSGSSLVVKEQPASASKTIVTLKRGDFVTVFSTTNGWSYVQAGQQKGYVVASFLAVPKSTIKIASSKGGLVVKATPSRAANTLATLQYNMIVEDFGSVGDGWSFVQYGNVTGYVVSTFIGTPKSTMKRTKETVQLRNIASKSGAVQATLNGGVNVRVHSTIAGWAFVTFGEVRGYVEAAKLVDVQNITTAYAKDYMPSCPKVYEFTYQFTYDDETDNGIDTYNCRIDGQIRELRAADPQLSIRYKVDGTKLHIGYYEGRDEFAFPLKVGAQWTVVEYEDYERTLKVVSLNEALTTKAGTFFNVIKVMETDEYGITYYYLAPNVGIAKVEGSGFIGGEPFELYRELTDLR